jgi:hypothetical protein
VVVLGFHEADEVEVDFVFGGGSSGVAEDGGGLVGRFEGRGIVEEVCTGARGEGDRRFEEVGEVRGGFFGMLASWVFLENGGVYR